MRIGVLGTGDVGQRLANGFLAKGHEVKMGTRDPRKEEVRSWVKQGGARASAGTPEECAKFAEVFVVATAWSGTENALRLAGAANLEGKLVLDVTNPLQHEGDGPPTLAVGHTDSGAEIIQRALPGAHVVKAWNIVGNPFMVDPDLPGGPPTMFVCGDEDSAKARAVRILHDFGWEVEDIGPLRGARYLEPMAMVWVMRGFVSGEWSHAFKLLRA